MANLAPTPTDDGTWTAWSKYVLISLEKLSEKVEEIQEKNAFLKQELQSEITKLREEFRLTMEKCKDTCRSQQDACQVKSFSALKELESEVEGKIDTLLNKLSTIESSDKFTKFKEEIRQEIKPISDGLLVIKTKLALWAVLFSMIGSGLMWIAFKLLGAKLGF